MITKTKPEYYERKTEEYKIRCLSYLGVVIILILGFSISLVLVWYFYTIGDIPVESLYYAWSFWWWAMDLAFAVMLVQFLANLYIWLRYESLTNEWFYTTKILSKKP